MATYPEICPIFQTAEVEVISVDHQYYARYTRETAEWNARTQFHPLFLDRNGKTPLTRENVRTMSGEFDMEDGSCCSPSAIIARGCFYTLGGILFDLGKEAGELMRFHVSGDLLEADRKYEVEEYWWKVQWEIDWATRALTATQYGWDPTAVITPENEAVIMAGKPVFSIMEMDEVRYLSDNRRKIRGRLWKKIQESIDTTQNRQEWDIRPFVDAVVAEYDAEHNQDKDASHD